MARGVRVEVIGGLLGLLDTVGDLLAIGSLACEAGCRRLSDRYSVETHPHRAARERLVED